MLEMFGYGFLTVSAMFFIILWMEGRANRNDEFNTVKDWHNFRNAFDQSNKGEK